MITCTCRNRELQWVAMQGVKMNHTYERRFLQRLGEAMRTGLACVFVGVTLEYVPAVKSLMVVSVLSYVITVLVSGPTLGTVLRNAVGLVAVAGPSLLSTMVVLQVLKPPITKFTAILCIGISSFFITYLSNTNLLGRKSALAQVCRSAKAAARGTSEVFNSAVNAFSAADESSFGSIYLHSKTLAKASTEIMTGLKAKQVNMAWEPGARRVRPGLKRTATLLAGLNQHLIGMEIAMESGNHLNAPATLRSSLRSPLEKLVAISKSLLQYGVKLGTSTSFDLESTETKAAKVSLVEEATYILNAFDKNLTDARRKAFYLSTGTDCSSDELSGEIQRSDGDGGVLWIDHRSTTDSGYVNRKFRGRISSYFFLFNMKLYLSEVVNLVETGDRKATTMHQIASVGPSIPELEESIHGQNSGAESLRPIGKEEDRDRHYYGDGISVSETEKEDPRKSSSHRRSTGIFSGETFVAAEDERRAPLSRQCSHRHGSIDSNCKIREDSSEPIERRSLVFASEVAGRFFQFVSKCGATKAQAKRSFKIALAMVIAATFGNMIVSKEKHAFWATVTVGFIIGNYQGGSWRIANLRLQGTVLGAIYGYLALTVTKNQGWANIMALIPWVVLSSFIRYSPAYGYSGLVSAFTAAILILGDFELDIKKYAMDRITETFVGVLAFVFVETMIFPERSVLLVRNELLSSLTGLRDCVAAIVAVYTEQDCLHCRNVAVHEIKQLEQQLRASFAKQKALRSEACLEPDLWFVPFAGDVYTNLIAIQGRMLDLLFFMVCSLHATTEDCLTEHMQKLLEALRSSLTALQKEVLSTIDSLRQVLQLEVQGPSKWRRFKTWLLKDSKKGVTDIENQQEQQRGQPLHPLLVLNHLHRYVDGSPLNLKSTMDRFERSFEDTVEDLIATTRLQPDSPVINNSVMLSFGSLTFSLHSLLRETVHLEKAVHELVQAENPWSVLDFWDTHSVTSLWQQQASVKV